MNESSSPAPAASRPAAARARVLVVEDHPLTGVTIQSALAADGFDVDLAATVQRGRARFEALAPDLAILDVHLPDGSGLDLCVHIRQTSNVPVIVVSGADSLEERIAGFDAGADDYVVKPVHVAELSKRVEAVLRRAGLRQTEYVVAGPLGVLLHVGSGEVEREGRRVRVTRSEVGILRALFGQPGVPVHPDDLSRLVWGYTAAADPNFIQQHISRLRRKLREVEAGDLIQTTYGVGYAVPPAA